ncbi:MAG: hypothetical protein RIB59_05265, partial [Rhodospirillales bacterium]
MTRADGAGFTRRFGFVFVSIILAFVLYVSDARAQSPSSLPSLSVTSDTVDTGVLKPTGENAVNLKLSSCFSGNRLNNSCLSGAVLTKLQLHQETPRKNIAQKGYAICGGVDRNRRLLPACSDVSATYVGKPVRACGKNEFYGGGNCMVCPKGFVRSKRLATGDKACTNGARTNAKFSAGLTARKFGCAAGAKFRTVNGGGCWSCPDKYKMVAGNPTKKKICRASELGWTPATYAEPGLFGIKGGPDIVLEFLKKPQLITDIMVTTALKSGAKTADIPKYVAAEWKIIRDDPNQSSILSGMGWAKLLDIIERPANVSRTTAEKAFVTDYGTYFSKRKAFIMADAIDMYDNWKVAADIRKQSVQNSAQNKLGAAVSFVDEPPDFARLAASSLTLSSVGVASFGVAAIGIASGKSLALFAPYAHALRAVAVDAVKVGLIATTTSGQSFGSVLLASA